MGSNASWLSSCERWPAGPTARPAMPALLNAQSIRPKAETVRATIAATSASRVTSPPMAIAWPPAALISATVACSVRLGAVGHRHPRAFPRHHHRGRLPDARKRRR